MDRKEIVNSQDYKAEGIALDWYKSLNAESVGEIHITDAYADGVIYGWNNPHWIPVEERLPEEGQEVFAWNGTFKESYKCIYHDGLFEDYLGALGKGAITHWMPIVPPRKEERNDNI